MGGTGTTTTVQLVAAAASMLRRLRQRRSGETAGAGAVGCGKLLSTKNTHKSALECAVKWSPEIVKILKPNFAIRGLIFLNVGAL